MPQIMVSTPFGPFALTEIDGFLTGLSPSRDLPDAETASPLLHEAASQLAAYFAGTLRSFDLPLRPAGTPFQLDVWKGIRAIPYAQTLSYSALATSIGRSTAVRAVANACGRNPLPFLIPCHRVVAANGLGGFSLPGGLTVKRALLAMEHASAPPPFENTGTFPNLSALR